MRKYIKDGIIMLPGLLAAIERWGGRAMDLIGLPEAAKQIEKWRIEYAPDIGLGTYWLIGFSIIGLIIFHTWDKFAPTKESTKEPKTHKERATDSPQNLDSTSNDLMPLWEAARIAYEETRNTLQSQLFERLNKSPSKMLGTMAQEIVGDALIPVFGTFPPSTKQEQLPKNEASEFGFTDDATELYDLFNESRRWNNLFVRRRDFERRLSEIKTKYEESDNVSR